MKKIYIACMVGVFLPCVGGSADSEGIDGQSIAQAVLKQGSSQMDSNEFVSLVLRRYYFIQRLKKTISVLSLFQKNLSAKKYPDMVKTHFFLAPEELLFGNTQIERSAVAIKENKNLNPLFDVWEDFYRYKYLNDDEFVEDFTREIFIISRNILLSGKDDKINMPLRSLKYQSLSPVQFCDVIDMLIDRVVNIRIRHQQDFSTTTFDFESASKELESVEPVVNIHYVITRFYLVKRLEKVFDIMNRVNRCIPCNLSYTINDKKDVVLENNAVIKDKQIKEAVIAMKRSQCWHPFLRLLKDIKSYKFVHNDARVRELMSLLFIMSRKLLVDIPAKGNVQTHRRASTLEAVNMLYQNVDQAAVSDLLDGIDVIMHEIPALLEKFEFNSDMSWSSWLKKYWWLPPTIIGAVGLKFYVQMAMHKNIVANEPVKPQDQPKPQGDTDKSHDGVQQPGPTKQSFGRRNSNTPNYNGKHYAQKNTAEKSDSGSQQGSGKPPFGRRNSNTPKHTPKSKPAQKTPLSTSLNEEEVDKLINELKNGQNS